MGQKELRWLLVIAVLPHQPAEHRGHGAWVITGAFEVDDADTVGLLLVLPGEATLGLDGCGLGGNDGGDARIAGPGCGCHDASKHGGHHRQLHALLGF